MAAAKMALSRKDMLSVTAMCIEKWAEIAVSEIQRITSNFESLDALDQHYLLALWMKRCDALMKVYQFIPDTDDIDQKYQLILERLFPMSEAARPKLEQDAVQRLNWFKKRVASDFEAAISRAIRAGTIQSPVEQFFLMEWEYSGLGRKYDIKLVPQAPVDTDAGRFFIDFAISPLGERRAHATIAIEIDGHEFHEKTRDQVRADKRRERAIIRRGITVLRFSGSEIVRNSRACVEEVAEYLRSLEGK